MANNGFKLVNCSVSMNGTIVGGVTELSVSRKDDNTTVHEAGNLDPLDIVSGKREYTGNVKHLWLLTSTIQDLQNFENNTTDDVYFNIKGEPKDGGTRSVVVEGVKFNGLDLNMTNDDVTSLSRDFDALRLKFN